MFLTGYSLLVGGSSSKWTEIRIHGDYAHKTGEGG